MAIKNAWARTSTLSSNEALENEADNAKDQMKTILKNAQTSDETRYVNEVYSAIESTFRNLATARNHFGFNLEELDERRKKSLADLDSTTTVSLDFQSLISRISAITFGGTGGLTGWGFLVNFVNAYLPELAYVDTVLLPLSLGVGAAIGYFAHNFWFVPRKAKKIQRHLVKTDYYRTLYYRLYLKRSKEALKSLYDITNELYKKIFNSGDYPKSVESQEAVDNLLKSMDFTPLACGKIDLHMASKEIEMNEDIWVRCETGINKEKCINWTNKRRK